MKSLGLVAFFLAVATVSAGLHAGVVAGLGSPAVIAGPAGTVVRSGLAHGAIIAGVPAIHGVGAVIAPGLLGHGLHGLIGSGIEGQYIHDFTETLYDDGSYKPHIYGH